MMAKTELKKFQIDVEEVPEFIYATSIEEARKKAEEEIAVMEVEG